MGFPFFVPAFIPGNRIRIYSCHPKVEQAIRGQNHEPCFPVEFEALAATIEFIALEPDKPYEIAGTTVTGTRQLHGNDSYGYRIEKDGRSFVYTTDSEHKPKTAKKWSARRRSSAMPIWWCSMPCIRSPTPSP